MPKIHMEDLKAEGFWVSSTLRGGQRHENPRSQGHPWQKVSDIPCVWKLGNVMGSLGPGRRRLSLGGVEEGSHGCQGLGVLLCVQWEPLKSLG